MKRIIIVLGILLLLMSCSKGTKSDEKILYIFNWTDYIGKTTIGSFENKAGVKVVYDNYSSNEELIAKLDTGDADYDIIFPSSYAVEILMAKKLLSEIDKAKIPNIKNVMNEFSHPEFDRSMRYCVPYTWSTTGLGYYKNKVTDSQADTWDVLFDPRYKRKILMLDDMRACLGMSLKAYGYSVNSTNIDEINKAKERLIAQKQIVHVYSSSNIPQLLASGEVELVYGWSGDILQAIEKNGNIKFKIPKVGTLMYVDYICIPANSKHKDLALKFINHILDGEVSAEIAETIYYATTNNKARVLSKGNTKELWNVLEKANEKANFEFVQNIGPALEYYDKAWREIKGGN